MRPPLLLASALVVVAAPAAAHVGAVPAKADFVHPAAPELRGSPMRWALTVEEADQSFLVDWRDGDLDPTGKFSFYYLDHGPSDGVTTRQIEQLGQPLRDVKGREALDVYVSCVCDADAGVACPDGGQRWCDNSLRWDTSALPEGVYWIAAVNHDPPFLVHNVSSAPVRVRHGGKPIPIVVVLKPDGLLAADRTYRIQLLAAGTGALTVDLAYGTNEEDRVLGPTVTMVKGLPYQPGADGSFQYDWDVSLLRNGNYFLRAAVKDQHGSSYSDSRYGLAVFHRAPADAGPDAATDGAVDAAAAIDAAATPKKGGCAVGGSLPERGRAGLALLLLAALATRLRRRRAPR